MLNHSPQIQKNNVQFCLDISGPTNYGVSWQTRHFIQISTRLSKNHSTNFCQSDSTAKISKGLDSGLLTGTISIDLQKAFDTIDRNILLLKMSSLGFALEVIDWYKSFLSSRKFHVNVHDKLSTSAELRCGVPQGSILGPLPFLLYINDTPQDLDCDLFLYS